MTPRPVLLLAALLACAQASFAEEASVFASNEMRAAGVKDRLRHVKATLKDGSDGARDLSEAVTAAFQGVSDWATATESYYARKGDLAARAAALEARFDAVIARNTPEKAEETAKALDAVCKLENTLRSDFEFYMKLPALAGGPQRPAAQAAMRLLGKTGDYPVTLAYFLDKTPNRPPFAPLPPGVMAIKHE